MDLDLSGLARFQNRHLDVQDTLPQLAVNLIDIQTGR
jgi:hypothetical protein